MKTALWLVALWLGCIASTWSAPWTEARETLTYNVRWGPVNLGKATLYYINGQKGAYAIEARVKDEAPFIAIDDRWRAEGQKDWTPSIYTATLRENDYHANKRITFKNNSALFQNLSSTTEPDQTIPLKPGTQDVLSALYGLRASGLDNLKKGRTINVLGLKKPFSIDVKPAVFEKDTQSWKVEMFALGDKRMDRWRIWLKNTADLTPTRIEARVKLGTFVATLKE